MTDLTVRPYHPADRAALFKIGADTAFFGAPIEAYMEDRNIFLDIFYAYYTDYEPEHAWVACTDGVVVGFLTGCTDTHRHDRIFSRKVIPLFLWNALRGKYCFGPEARRYFAAGIGAMRRGEVENPDLTHYPAHLHINLSEAWRGHGLGRRLIESYLDQLRSLGVPGVHLMTTNMNVVACQLYEHLGFHLIAEHPTVMYARWVKQTVTTRTYVRNV
jgi:GNAT superfamily N-acetyltransferase